MSHGRCVVKLRFIDLSDGRCNGWWIAASVTARLHHIVDYRIPSVRLLLLSSKSSVFVGWVGQKIGLYRATGRLMTAAAPVTPITPAGITGGGPGAM